MLEDGGVLEKVCEEKHKSVLHNQNHVETVLVEHYGRIKTVEDALIKLTIMVDNLNSSKSKDTFWNKIQLTAMIILCIIMLMFLIGPELTGKIINNIK